MFFSKPAVFDFKARRLFFKDGRLFLLFFSPNDKVLFPAIFSSRKPLRKQETKRGNNGKVYLTIVILPAFTTFSFSGTSGSAYPKATHPYTR
ncbi:Uncharacterised protein [Bacteroides pyogenes]|nr:Uncharacterised protein [Bacteroides pyogenes]